MLKMVKKGILKKVLVQEGSRRFKKVQEVQLGP